MVWAQWVLWFLEGDTIKPHIILESYKLLWQTPGREIGVTFFTTETSIKCYHSFFFEGVFYLDGGCARLSNGAFWDPTNLRSFRFSSQPTPTNEMSTHQANVNLNQRKNNNQPQTLLPNFNQPDPISTNLTQPQFRQYLLPSKQRKISPPFKQPGRWH